MLHRRSQYLNNLTEQDYRAIKQRYLSPEQWAGLRAIRVSSAILRGV